MTAIPIARKGSRYMVAKAFSTDEARSQCVRRFTVVRWIKGGLLLIAFLCLNAFLSNRSRIFTLTFPNLTPGDERVVYLDSTLVEPWNRVSVL